MGDVRLSTARPFERRPVCDQGDGQGRGQERNQVPSALAYRDTKGTAKSLTLDSADRSPGLRSKSSVQKDPKTHRFSIRREQTLVLETPGSSVRTHVDCRGEPEITGERPKHGR